MLQTIVFFIGQFLFFPTYMLSTGRLLGRKLSRKEWLGYSLLSPLAAYFYTTILVMILGILPLSSGALQMIARGSDLIIFLFSFLFMLLYYRKVRCGFLGAFLYSCLYMIAMPFTSVYDDLLSTILLNLLMPLLVNFFFFHILMPQIVELRSYTKDSENSIFITLPVIAELMFALRIVSFVFFSIHQEELEKYDYPFTIYNAVYAFLILLFVFTAILLIIKNIRKTSEARIAGEKLQTLTWESMEALARAVDAKDIYTNGHSARVGKYSRMIAEKMGKSPEETNKIYYAALMHDIGKIGIEDTILTKPGRLTKEEFLRLMEHPKIGYHILKDISSMPDLGLCALYHHERWDGTGYPSGLKGEDIPEIARIVAVADSYDAMSATRSYRETMPQEKIRSEIENGCGTQYWPPAAKAMLQIIDEDADYQLKHRS